MNLSRRSRLLCGFVLAVLAGPTLAAPVRSVQPRPAASARDEAPLLNPVFANHMVLQRNRPIRFWGEAAAGADDPTG